MSASEIDRGRERVRDTSTSTFLAARAAAPRGGLSLSEMVDSARTRARVSCTYACTIERSNDAVRVLRGSPTSASTHIREVRS